MKFNFDKKYLCWGITAFLVICAGICFYYLLFHGYNIGRGIRGLLRITMPVLDGFMLAYLLAPALNQIEKKLLYPFFSICLRRDPREFSLKCKKKIRKLSIVLTLLIVGILLYCFFSILIPQLITSIQNIIVQFPYYLSNLNKWVIELFDNNPSLEETVTALLERYSDRVEEWVSNNIFPQFNMVLKTLYSGVIGSAINLAKALWNLLIGLIISVYLLDGKERFAGQGKKLIYSLMNKNSANIFVSNVRFIHRTFIGFIGGKIIDSIIIGIICYFGTMLLGTPYPMLISVIIGVTNIIPFFGPYMGAIPSALLILMVNPLQCLYFIIFILILQQFDGNILGPKILGDSTGLNSFWVIFAIMLFGGLFGVTGMILGVPVFAVIYAGIRENVNHRLRQRQLPTNTEMYVDLLRIEGESFLSTAPYKRGRAERASEKDEKESGERFQIGLGESWLLFKHKERGRDEKEKDEREENQE